jgi:hypothetical protein
VRPKKAAKNIAKITGKPLSLCQQEIAKACGYRDWRDLEKMHRNDAHNSQLNEQRINLWVSIITHLSKQLATNSGNILCAISESRLIQSDPIDPYAALNIRCRLFETDELPYAGRRKQGAIGKLKTFGRNGEHVILRKYGQPTRVVTHRSANSLVVDFEYISPRSELKLFIPMRLYIPYGIWVEEDGAEVLFSRDYLPLWRVREGRVPERIAPWEWINYVDQKWLWDEAHYPWSNLNTYQTSMQHLQSLGVHGLPLLVEALPIVVTQDSVRDFEHAVPILRDKFS